MNGQRTSIFHCTFIDPNIEPTDVTTTSASPSIGNVGAAISEHTGIDPKQLTLLNTETGGKLDRNRSHISDDITNITVVVNPPPETKVYKFVIETADRTLTYCTQLTVPQTGQHNIEHVCSWIPVHTFDDEFGVCFVRNGGHYGASGVNNHYCFDFCQRDTDDYRDIATKIVYEPSTSTWLPIYVCHDYVEKAITAFSVTVVDPTTLLRVHA